MGIVSNAFTLLCLSPFLLMLILWTKLGANISNLPLSLPAIGFHLGLGAIFCLYAMFWLQLNMFQTVKYLVVLGVVTFLCGNSLLSTIARRGKKAERILDCWRNYESGSGGLWTFLTSCESLALTITFPCILMRNPLFVCECYRPLCL